MKDSTRPPPLFVLSADYVAAVLSAIVLSMVAMESPVIDSMDLFRVIESVAPGFGVQGAEPSLTPWFFLVVKYVVGDALWAGKALAVFSGVGCVVFSTRLFGPWAGLWVLAQSGVLMAAKQADPALLPIFFFLISMSLSARGFASFAGCFAAIAVGCAAWMWPFAVGVFWVSHQRYKTVFWLSISVCMLAFCGVSVIPEFRPPAAEHIDGLMTQSFWTDVVLQLGALALLWGLIRRNRGSIGLAVTLLFGVIGYAVIPTTPENGLHLQICFALAVAAVEAGPTVLLGALIVLGLRLPDAFAVSSTEAGRRTVLQAMSGRTGRVLCTTQNFVYRDANGWLQGCVGLDYLGRSATDVFPRHVLNHAKRMNVEWFALEDRAVLQTYPWLQALLDEPYPAGFSVMAQADGWRVFKLDP